MASNYPFDPAIIADPYPFYAQLREQTPAFFLEALDCYVISLYKDAELILNDPTAFSSHWGLSLLRRPGKLCNLMQGHNTVFTSSVAPGERAGFCSLIGSDPPNHTRLRQLASKVFSTEATSGLRLRIREICEELVDDFCSANQEGKADLVTHIAHPLPALVVAEMLGIPAERRSDFLRCTDDLLGWFSTEERTEAQATRGSMKIVLSLSAMIDKYRRYPGEDLISMLVSNVEGGDAFNPMEIVMLVVLLLVAGNETTTNLIANGALALFKHPEICSRLRRQPELTPSLIEETLRYDSPVQALVRATTRPVEIQGVSIPENAPLLILIGAANRDPAHYAAPDEFLLDRNPTDHLTFGRGIHHCLSAPLARLEARIVIETLLRRTRAMQLNGEPKRSNSFFLRGLTHMPVFFEPVSHS